MKLDDLLREIGEFGPYQQRLYLLSAAPTALVAAEALSVIFIFFIPDHRCAIPWIRNDAYSVYSGDHNRLVNLSIPYTEGTWDSCHEYNDVIHVDDVNGTTDVMPLTNRSQSICNRWVFDQSIFRSTVATDFNVVCDHSILRAESNVVSELGTVFGMLVCGILADRFGRKLTFLLSSLVLFAGGIGIAFVKSLVTLNICRFILGFARQSTYINGMVLGMEVLGPSKRAFAGMVICLFWCLGEFYLTFIAYFIRNWRYLEIAVSVPGIFLVAYWWLLPESPRWWISRGRDNEAMAVLQKIADSNKRPMPPIGDMKQLLKKDPQLSLRHVFRSRELMKRLLIVALNIFVNVLVYYGVALNITNLSGDIFLNSAITFALEGLACGIALIALGRVGRKPVYIASLLAGGVCCVLSVLPIMLGASAWVVTGLSMVGRFFIVISFAVICIYGAELFPTFVRASAIGMCISFSRLANLLSPYLADLALLVDSEFKDALPLMVMGTPAILVALLALLLPETRGVNLPETLQDLETGTKNFWCCREQEQTSCPQSTEREAEDPLTNGGQYDDIHISTAVL